MCGPLGGVGCVATNDQGWGRSAPLTTLGSVCPIGGRNCAGLIGPAALPVLSCHAHKIEHVLSKLAAEQSPMPNRGVSGSRGGSHVLNPGTWGGNPPAVPPRPGGSRHGGQLVALRRRGRRRWSPHAPKEIVTRAFLVEVTLGRPATARIAQSVGCCYQ